MAPTLVFNCCPIGHIKEILGDELLQTTCKFYLGTDKRAAKEAHAKFLDYETLSETSAADGWTASRSHHPATRTKKAKAMKSAADQQGHRTGEGGVEELEPACPPSAADKKPPDADCGMIEGLIGTYAAEDP